jgi:hypothetical protein
MTGLPVFVEDSKLPVILSKVAPIEIWAISLGLFVFCRGKLSLGDKIHETIHYKQWIELGILGFMFLYPAFWLLNLAKGMGGKEAYLKIPFEVEAYDNDNDIGYIFRRKPYAWARKDVASLRPPVS